MKEVFSNEFIKKIQRLKIASYRSFLGNRQGSHLSKKRGQGLEFSDFRPYTSGDDFRHIDWGIYGRTDRLYIRQFRAEEDLNIIILLDTSASMNFPATGSKLEFAKKISLALGFITLANGDAVTYSFLGQNNTKKFFGLASFSQIVQESAKLKASNNYDFLKAIHASLAGQKIPGKCFVISDFLFSTEEQFAALDLLRAKNYEITVIQILSPEELELNGLEKADLIDSETAENLEVNINSGMKEKYKKILKAHQQALFDYCREARITCLQLDSSKDFNQIVLQDFVKQGILK